MLRILQKNYSFLIDQLLFSFDSYKDINKFACIDFLSALTSPSIIVLTTYLSKYFLISGACSLGTYPNFISAGCENTATAKLSYLFSLSGISFISLPLSSFS